MPGEVDAFTVHPSGAVYVTGPMTGGSRRHLSNDRALYVELAAALSIAPPPIMFEPSCELRVTHGYPPAIEWSWRGAGAPFTPAPHAATQAFLVWLARTVLADATVTG